VITVLIADDHTVVRDGLAALLGYYPAIQVVATASTGAKAVESYFALAPDVALVDLQMPVGDGVWVIDQIRRRKPDAVIIVLTTYRGDEDVFRAVSAGAKGYLLKDCEPRALVETIRAVARGETSLDPELLNRVQNRGPSLSQRELEVLENLARGQSNREIAGRLFISEATVKAHLVHIFQKLDANDRVTAIRVARERGILRG